MDGVLIINKQTGMTSHDVVAKTRKILKTKKIGHTGTLDPEATGVLILCIGKATKLSRFFMAEQKEYSAAMVLGKRTDTQDRAGKIVSEQKCPEFEKRRVEDALLNFEGEIQQIPPMVSAVRHRGKKLYELARKGSEVERQPRKVTIKSITLLSYVHPEIRFKVVCSKGTYIRTLCSDIGDFLGCGAHQSELTRTRSGHFKIENAMLLEELEKSTEPRDKIIPIDAALAHLPAVVLKGWARKFISKGFAVKQTDTFETPHLSPGQLAGIKDAQGRLLAIGAALPPAGKDGPVIEIVHRI